MGDDIEYRETAVRGITTEIGVYVLCDLDDIAVYVGQSRDGIRARVRRHLTSARSDVIANKQIDVWEIAFVRSYPVDSPEDLNGLESALFHHFDRQSRLMNGSVPVVIQAARDIPDAAQSVQIMSDADIAERRQPEQRLPRQSRHYAALVDHFLTIKNSPQIARAMDAHFDRMRRYHAALLDEMVD